MAWLGLFIVAACGDLQRMDQELKLYLYRIYSREHGYRERAEEMNRNNLMLYPSH